MPAKKATLSPVDVLRKELPAGIDRLNGKQYVNHKGLVYLAGKGEPFSCETEVLDVEKGADGLPVYVMTRTTITVHGDPVRIYSAIGDATAKNTGIAKTALPRMSETRSANRALRIYLGAPETTAEEMPAAEADAAGELQLLRDITRERIKAGAWDQAHCAKAIASMGAQRAEELTICELVELRTIISTHTGADWTSRSSNK